MCGILVLSVNGAGCGGSVESRVGGVGGWRGSSAVVCVGGHVVGRTEARLSIGEKMSVLVARKEKPVGEILSRFEERRRR